jgi:hypothetical protein
VRRSCTSCRPVQARDGAFGCARHVATFHSIRLAAAYNAGPGAIVGRAVPQNGETEIYVVRVMHALSVGRRARCVEARRPA